MYECFAPYMTEYEIPVRCGKCDNCRGLNTAHWQFRLMQEEKRSLNALFVTLTYDTKHAVLSPSGLFTLDRKAIPSFIKRLRSFTARTDKGIREFEQGKRKRRPKVQDNWLVGMPPIKYYGVGEYGHKFKRPHYHVIIFNAHEDAVLNAWKFGSVHIGKVSGASVGYTLKYIRKRTWEGCFEGDDREPVFALQSKNLGANYINERTRKFHESGENYYVALEGRIIPMPRYYRERMISDETMEEVQLVAAKRNQQKNSITQEEYYEKVYENYALNRSSLNTPKPCSNTGTTARKKTKPVKRNTHRVKRSPTKV